MILHNNSFELINTNSNYPRSHSVSTKDCPRSCNLTEVDVAVEENTDPKNMSTFSLIFPSTSVMLKESTLYFDTMTSIKLFHWKVTQVNFAFLVPVSDTLSRKSTTCTRRAACWARSADRWECF